MRIRDLIGIAVLCLPTPLLAQSTNGALCGATADAEIFGVLSGNYSLVHGPGTLTMMGNVMPFPQSEPLAARLLEWEGELLLYEETSPLRLKFALDDSTAPLAQIAPGTPLQKRIDELNAAACPRGNGALPYLSGEGTWLSADGVQMSAVFTVVFSMSQEGSVHGWGFMQSSGGGAELATQMVLDEVE
jgi:hypothetical protein